MKQICGLALLVTVGLLAGLAPETGNAQDKKDRVFVIDGLKGEVPADWIVEKPANRLRYLQFRLPKVEGDAVDAELIVTKAIGGSPEANVKRWKDQFMPPQGKTADDLRTQSPPVVLLDDDFRRGRKLLDYKIEGDGVPRGTGLRFDVALTLQDGNKPPTTRKLAYRVVTEPNVSISREDS